jgi:SAM-dependent methyltransferase
MKQPAEMPPSSENLWLNMWKTTEFDTVPLWGDVCALVYCLLRKFLPSNISGKTVLETGSGTGRISLRLAKDGAKVLLLDLSPDILKFSKRMFRNQGLDGFFIVGDIFHLPFRNATLDIVWSSGVLEHYTNRKQKKAFDEALRVIEKRGRCIIIVPNSKAFIYNLFRKLDMKMGRWKFGYEEPMSFKNLYHLPKPLVFYSRGFIYQLRFISIPLLGTALNVLAQFLSCVLPIFTDLDKKAPGYLIGGLWKK